MTSSFSTAISLCIATDIVLRRKTLPRPLCLPFNLARDAKCWKRARLSRELLFKCIDVVGVDVCVPNRVHKITRPQATDVSNHNSEQRVASNVKRHTETLLGFTDAEHDRALLCVIPKSGTIQSCYPSVSLGARNRLSIPCRPNAGTVGMRARHRRRRTGRTRGKVAAPSLAGLGAALPVG